MNSRSTLLLEHHLKELKLPSFLREYDKMAAQCAAEGVDHPRYLLRLAELELIDRHQRIARATGSSVAERELPPKLETSLTKNRLHQVGIRPGCGCGRSAARNTGGQYGPLYAGVGL